MTSFLFFIGRIHGKQFECNYLRNKKLFLNLLLHFWNLHQFLDFLKKNMALIVYVFAKLETATDLVS